MSFGKSMFPAEFNHKTAKEDLFIKGNHRIPPRNRRGKTLEDFRRLSTKVGHMSLTCGASKLASHAGCLAPRGPTYQPPCYVGSPPPSRMHLHHLFKTV
jgi:hypothetical protein